jgi:3-phenylpropionate/trans-cinnamate dioxygenase ferredoxin subunit
VDADTRSAGDGGRVGTAAVTDHAVARVGEIPNRGRKLVSIEGRSVGLFNVDGNYFAVRNVCAHQGGPVCEGLLVPRHLARVGSDRRVTEYLEHDRPVLSCPWHGWEYDLATGECLADPERRVATYPVRVEADQVIVELRT